jgi:ribosomal protein S18 acetylase RimI-like enzyme
VPDFRPFTGDDVEPIIVMMRALFTNDGAPFNEAGARRGLAVVASPAGAAAARVWIIEEDTQPAGYIALTFSFSFEFGGWYGFIDELYLEERYRGRGWGSAAIEFAAETCRALGMSALLLEADLANVKATALYRRRGFVEHRRRLMRRALVPQ